jgi:hypothetical protein
MDGANKRNSHRRFRSVAGRRQDVGKLITFETANTSGRVSPVSSTRHFGKQNDDTKPTTVVFYTSLLALLVSSEYRIFYYPNCSMTSEMEHDAVAFQLADDPLQPKLTAAAAAPKRKSSISTYT